MASLKDALANKDFVVSLELDPPAGVDLEPLLQRASAAASRVDALVLADNPGAEPRQDPLLAGYRLASGGTDCALVTTLCCRDCNRLALTSRLFSAWAAGLREVLVVSGDFVTLGPQPGAKPVYDLDSVQALGLAAGLPGIDGGFSLGAAVSAVSEPRALHVMKLRKKQRAGATWFMTTPLSDAEALKELLQAMGDDVPPVLAGVDAGGEGGAEAAAALISQLRAAGARGVHISGEPGESDLNSLLAACGR